jgi:hypothetical protein
MAGDCEYSIWNTIEALNNPYYNLNTRLNVLWYAFQYIIFFPMTIITIYRFLNQISNEDYYDNKRSLPSSYLGIFCKFFSMTGFSYYLINTLLLWDQIFIPCRFVSITHHIATLYGSFFIILAPYHPWFVLAPLTFHSLLLMFANIGVLKYIYITLVAIGYYGLGQKPFDNKLVYQRIRFSVILLIFPFLLFWLFSCDNTMYMETISS